MYSNLSAFISTKQWITDTCTFPIQRGVFQGDTLSPLIFLLCFNPILKLAQSLQGKGFSLHLPVPSSEGLPPVGSHFYVEWNEVDSPDPSGFYLCTAIRYHSDGTTTIQYIGDGATERVDLHSIFWSFTRKNSKPFLPPGSSLKHYPLKKIRGEASHRKTIYSVPHKVKAFADDLSLIHSSPSVHQQELSAIDSHCLDLDLVIRPDKCVSFVFDGSSMKSSSSFSLSSAQIMSSLPRSLVKLSARILQPPDLQLSQRFINALLNINSRPIRGEYKAWILKHYLAPSLFFHLAVDKFSTTPIKQLQSQATKMLKKWLHPPMSTTLPVLFHPLVMKFPHLPSLRDKAILSMLASISSSSDQLVKEASLLLEDAKYANRQSIPALF